MALGALAAAKAETGAFPAAVQIAEHAIEIAGSIDAPYVAALKQQLSLYEAGFPYHEREPEKR